MSSVNLELKAALIKKFGSQITAADVLGIHDTKLSYLVRGHRKPTATEREILKRVLGKDHFESAA